MERMIVKMECGSASLIRHISLSSLRSAAAHLLESSSSSQPLGMQLIDRRPHTEDPRIIQAGCQHRPSGVSNKGLHAASGPATAVRRSSVQFRDEQSTGDSDPAEALQVWAQKLSGGDITVLRLAALRKWAGSGDYESLLERCTQPEEN